MKKWIFLLRSFFPKWTFFDEVGTEFRLEVRLDRSEFEDWKAALPPIRRSAKNLFFNPEANYLHACHNHLTYFSHKLMRLENLSTDHVASLTSYQITKNLAQFQIEQKQFAQAPFFFQFRIVAIDLLQSQSQPQVILTSPSYEVV